jgi:hypothetical protein
MTLTEVMLVSALMAIIVPSVTALFFYFTDGMAFYEASNELKKENQEAFDNLYLKVGQNKRLYQNDANGTALLTRLNMSGMTSTLPNSADRRLPYICTAGSFAAAASDSSAVPVTAYGNMLLFLTQEPRFLCKNVINSAGVASNVQVDIYKLHCFYLTTDNPNPIQPLSRNTRLVEWQSAPLADYNMMTYLYNQDATLAKNAVAQMVAPTPMATPQAPVNYAVDPSDDVASCFYIMSASSTPPVAFSGLIPYDIPVTIAGAGHVALQKNPGLQVWTHLTLMGGGRVFPNSVAMNDPKLIVPRYTAISGNFPGGFEVGITGPGSARQVLVRIVHLAKTMKRIASIDQFQIIECKDSY